MAEGLLATRQVAATGTSRPGLDQWTRWVLAFVCVFVAVRPWTDLAKTYERGPNVNSALGVLVLGAVVAWGWRARAETATLASGWAALLLAVAGVFSAMGSYEQPYSVGLALRLLTVAGLYLFAYEVGRRDPAAVLAILGAVLVSAVGGAVLVLAQSFGLIPLPSPVEAVALDPQLGRPPGPFEAPTVVATLIFMGIGVLLVLVPRAWRSPRVRWIALCLLLAVPVFAKALLDNKSRGAAIGLAIAVGLFCILRWRWVGAAVFVAMLLLLVAFVPVERTRFDEVGTGTTTPGAESDTLAWRLNYWETNLPRVAESPLTGIGLGRVEQINLSRNPPHNTAVQSIVEMGAFGALAYVAFVFLLLRDLLAGLARSRGSPDHDLAILALSFCVGYFFAGLFDNLLTQVVISGPMALITGVALGRVRAQA